MFSQALLCREKVKLLYNLYLVHLEWKRIVLVESDVGHFLVPPVN